MYIWQVLIKWKEEKVEKMTEETTGDLLWDPGTKFSGETRTKKNNSYEIQVQNLNKEKVEKPNRKNNSSLLGTYYETKVQNLKEERYKI